MSAAKQLVRPFTTVLLLAVTVLGLVNVYGDNSEVKNQAQLIACGGKECPSQLARLERNPIAQTFEIVAEPKGPRKGSETITVRCTRTQILIGSWECQARK